MAAPRAWIEVIDPVTQRKVDVVIGFHSDWTGVEPWADTVAKTNRIVHAITQTLTQLPTLDEAPFRLSDIEEATR